MDLIRTEPAVGQSSVVVGDTKHNIVLESAGQVYLRFGKNYSSLTEAISKINTVVNDNGEIAAPSLVMVSSIDGIGSYKDGTLIYETTTGDLYIMVFETPVPLIKSQEANSQYVKVAGDTMTGQLIINPKQGPALQVTTKDLIQNFNADLLDDHHGDEYALKAKDEEILGFWIFLKDTQFFGNIDQYIGGIYTDNFMQSHKFEDGGGGYGWRLGLTGDNKYGLIIDDILARESFVTIIDGYGISLNSTLFKNYINLYEVQLPYIVYGGIIKPSDRQITHLAYLEKSQMTKKENDNQQEETVEDNPIPVYVTYSGPGICELSIRNLRVTGGNFRISCTPHKFDYNGVNEGTWVYVDSYRYQGSTLTVNVVTTNGIKSVDSPFSIKIEYYKEEYTDVEALQNILEINEGEPIYTALGWRTQIYDTIIEDASENPFAPPELDKRKLDEYIKRANNYHKVLKQLERTELEDNLNLVIGYRIAGDKDEAETASDSDPGVLYIVLKNSE